MAEGANRVRLGLFRRRDCLLPTWRGWLLIFLAFGLLLWGAMRTVHPFLAITDSKPGGFLVVEGWSADYGFEAAVREFNRNHYEAVLVTGGPLEYGAPLSEYKTYAQLGEANLHKLGLSTNVVRAVPAPYVAQDRTFTCGVALKAWLREHGRHPTTVNLMTMGAHARRSRLLFEKALGKEVTVGIVAVPPEDYEPRHWWRSSNGVRTLMSEVLGYVYARFLFRAPVNPQPGPKPNNV